MTCSAEFECCICGNEYGGTNEQGEKVIPAVMTCCGRHLCCSCVELDRSTKIANLERNRKKIQCMFCKRPYHSSKDKQWIVSTHFIGATGIDVDTGSNRRPTAVNNADDEDNSNIASETDIRPSDQGDGEGDQGDGEGEENDEVEVIDLTNDGGEDASTPLALANRDTGTTLRRSRRLNLRSAADAGGEEEVQSSSNNEMVTSTGANLRRSRRRNLRSAADAGVEEVQSSLSNEVVANTRRSKRLRINGVQAGDEHDERSNVRANNNDEMEHILEPISPDKTGDRRWTEEISKAGLYVYRIRCYNHVSTAEDKFARRVSKWCVNNGLVATKLAIAKILPRDQWFDGEALKKKVASLDNEKLREMWDKCDDFNYYDRKERRYLGSRKQFIDMKKGSIVVLHTAGGYGKGDPPQTLTFGVVEDDTLTAMTNEEAMQMKCPLDLSDPNLPVEPSMRMGFMVRKVRWLRQGELQSVRGPNQVNWLAECSPLWLMKIGTTNENMLRTAIRKMKSEKFMRNTHSIDNQWTMG